MYAIINDKVTLHTLISIKNRMWVKITKYQPQQKFSIGKVFAFISFCSFFLMKKVLFLIRVAMHYYKTNTVVGSSYFTMHFMLRCNCFSPFIVLFANHKAFQQFQ